jgi:hypothetical protein
MGSISVNGVRTIPLFTTTTTDAFAGGVAIRSENELRGAELDGLYRVMSGCGYHLDLLAGVRYVALEDKLDITSNVIQEHAETTVNRLIRGDDARFVPAGFAGTILNNFTAETIRTDKFEAHNDFYGGQVGARGECRWGKLAFILDGKVALGDMNETVNINGGTVAFINQTATPTRIAAGPAGPPLVIPAGAPVTSQFILFTPGGVFAQPTNIGHYSRDVFAVIPEVNLKVGYDVTENVRATLGYSFLYISDVVRAGQQIDPVITSSLLANPPVVIGAVRPAFPGHSTDFWAQGLTAGFEIRF